MTGNEFIHGFLQHTLPSRFQRIRYYGFASQNSKSKFAWVWMLVWFYQGWCYLLKKQTAPEMPVRRGWCNGEMRLVEVTDGDGRVVYRKRLRQRALTLRADANRRSKPNLRGHKRTP